MAINFLDNIQLNQNQLLGARIENVTSDPTSANGGDIIFNSTSGTLKYYDGTNPFSSSGWISLPDGTGIGGNGTVGTIPVFNSTTEITDSQLITTGSGASQTFLFNTNGDVTFKGSISFDGGGGIKDKDGQLGTSSQLLSSTGTQVNWIDAPVSYTKWVLTGDTGSQDIEDGNTVLVAGGTNITTAATATDTITINASTYTIAASGGAVVGHDSQVVLTCNPGTNSDFYLDGTANEVEVAPGGIGTNAINIGLPTNVTIPGDLTVGGGDISLTGTGRIQGVDTVTAATDAANKQYVDNAVVGGFNVKGGFNANTGITAVAGTNLYTNTTVAVGDYYVVTVAGNFFGQASTPLTVGDSVLAQTAAASGSASITDFAVIQSDTDLATVNAVGIGNVNVDGPGDLDGLALSYSAGTATVGVDIKNNASTFTALSEMLFLVYDGNSTGTNLSLPIEAIATYVNGVTSFAGTSSSGTTHTFNHNLNSFDVMVQVYNNAISTQDTVYAETVRTSVNQVVVTTASSANIRCLIQKIS